MFSDDHYNYLPKRKSHYCKSTAMHLLFFINSSRKRIAMKTNLDKYYGFFRESVTCMYSSAKRIKYFIQFILNLLMSENNVIYIQKKII